MPWTEESSRDSRLGPSWAIGIPDDGINVIALGNSHDAVKRITAKVSKKQSEIFMEHKTIPRRGITIGNTLWLL